MERSVFPQTEMVKDFKDGVSLYKQRSLSWLVPRMKPRALGTRQIQRMVALEDELSVVLLHLVTQGVERDPLSVSVSGAGKPLEGRHSGRGY